MGIPKLRPVKVSYGVENLDVFDHYDPRFSELRSKLPHREIMTRLSRQDADERASFLKDQKPFRSYALGGHDPAEVLLSFHENIVNHTSTPLREAELRALAEYGPQLSVSWSNYSEERFYPHYMDYEIKVDLEYVDELFNAVDEYLSQWIHQKEPWDPVRVYMRRKRSSNLGPTMMTSLDDLSPNEERRFQRETYAYVDGMLEGARRGEIVLPFERLLAMTGTRVSHAPLWADGEDHNRVILAIDVQGFMTLGSFMYPVYESMKSMSPFANIWYRSDIRAKVRAKRGTHTFIGGDSSRMDQRLRYYPFGIRFSNFLSSHFDPCYRDLISRLIMHHHQPLVFTPDGICDGFIGNPSGAVSTTAENSYMTVALLFHLLHRLGLSFSEIISRMDKDIWCMAHGDDAGLIVPTELLDGLDINSLISSSWDDLGFKAKKEKQDVSDRYLFFLKRFWSDDPEIGDGTMTLANVLKKLVFQLSSSTRTFDTLDFEEIDLNDPEIKIKDYEAIARANRRARRWLKYKAPYGIIPSSRAEWPYLVADEAAFRMLQELCWSGADGPVSRSEFKRCVALLDRSGISTDPKQVSVMSAIQAISECYSHPEFDRFLVWFVSLARDRLGDTIEMLNLRWLMNKSSGAYEDDDPQQPVILRKSQISVYCYGLRNDRSRSLDVSRRIKHYMEALESPLDADHVEDYVTMYDQAREMALLNMCILRCHDYTSGNSKAQLTTWIATCQSVIHTYSEITQTVFSVCVSAFYSGRADIAYVVRQITTIVQAYSSFDYRRVFEVILRLRSDVLEEEYENGEPQLSDPDIRVRPEAGSSRTGGLGASGSSGGSVYKLRSSQNTSGDR